MISKLTNRLVDKLFPPEIIYIRLSKNAADVRNIKRGNSIKRVSPIKFSNDRLIIADFSNAEKFLKECIAELIPKKGILSKLLIIVIQPIDENMKKIAPVEKRTYLDSMEHLGAKKVFVIEEQKVLGKDEILKLATQSSE
ncbi:MAG: rod shape-determining protein [Fluviicola sp.]|nr:rod shape-determining protein [Fluviicola sp.]